MAWAGPGRQRCSRPWYCAPGPTLQLQDRLADVPVYANVKAVLGSGGVLEAYEITYLTLYAHNGHYALGGVPLPLLHVGAHDGDWEHCTARWARCGPVSPRATRADAAPPAEEGPRSPERVAGIPLAGWTPPLAS